MALVVVAGALANKPGNGGAAWTRLSWALGFRTLGFDVYFIEQISPSACVDSRGTPVSVGDSINLAYFQAVTTRYGLGGRSALVAGDEPRIQGAGGLDLAGVASSADLLVNISGNLTFPALKRLFRRKVFIDLDPGYTQFWQVSGLSREQVAGHDVYFTVAENIGQAGCDIPSGGIGWLPIRQPVLLDQWPMVESDGACRFTTIGSWRGAFGAVPHGQGTYGLKAHEFRKFIDLPRHNDAAFEIALDIHPNDAADRQRLREHRWSVVDAAAVAGNPDAFRGYVQSSSAEFSVAQGIYVETRSGWFSDRTTRYLASGKPALVQDTGLSRNYPVGEGLLVFRTLEDAVQGVESIRRDYQKHARAARALAEQFFDARVVLPEVVAAAGAAV